MSDDGFGITQNEGAIFTTYDVAKNHGDTMGNYKNEPKECLVLEMDNGELFRLEKESIAVYTSEDALKRKVALSKLTKEERKLLGL